METIEKQLADYNGFEVWKYTDNKGLKTEHITYMIYYKGEMDCLNAFNSLKDLKKWADMYVK